MAFRYSICWIERPECDDMQHTLMQRAAELLRDGINKHAARCPRQCTKALHAVSSSCCMATQQCMRISGGLEMAAADLKFSRGTRQSRYMTRPCHLRVAVDAVQQGAPKGAITGRY